MIDGINTMALLDDECPLVSELKKLKKSSSEAIDSDESFSEFKKYMHIHRSIENDLVDKIEQAKKSPKKSLILVCGNVGDGKSHIISYLKHNKQELLDGFIIHNDATESRSRIRDEKEELAKVLVNFSDVNINNNAIDKVIVAINLGVLSNFIDKENGKGKEFSILAEYVNKNNILIDTVTDNHEEFNNIFYHINFGDYHMFRLNNKTIDSPYISEVIDKIFSQNENNNFFSRYIECEKCSVVNCPVKMNYEMLQNLQVRSGLIDVIIEAIVKDKIILSTRELLDFFYDIVVHPDFDKATFLKKKNQNKIELFITYSLPSLIYEHNDVSSLLKHIKEYDFVNQRTELFDEITTRFNTTDNISDVFKEYISENAILNYLLSIDLNEVCKNSSKNSDLKNKLFLLFTRMCKLSPKRENFAIVNEEYKNFIEDLFYSIKCDAKKMKSLYRTVEKCIYNWNGGSYLSGRINLRNDVEGYIVSSELELAPDTNAFGELLSEDVFEKFPTYINLSITKKKEPEKAIKVSIDYDLYKILKLVENGYRPSAKDNNRYIGFLSFINQLSEYSSFEEEIIIQQLSDNKLKKYKLSKGAFGYTFGEEK